MAGRSYVEIGLGLGAWAADRFRAGALVRSVHDLGGHSGETFGFSILTRVRRHELVVRVAPPGVARRGSTDVLRPAPLLRTLHAAGMRVPSVVDACEDERFLGSPFLVVERLRGEPLTMGPKAGLPAWARDGRRLAYLAAVDELARLHAQEPVTWECPRSPRDEIEAWVSIFEKSVEPDWAAKGQRLRSRLLDTLPGSYRMGVCHGDFQTNNILFSAGDGQPVVEGVVDWEVAHIGAVEHDLAWFLMMNDPDAWDPVEKRGGVDLAEITERYCAASGAEVAHLAWFQALACYRIAAIAVHNIRLHRRGRRIDEDWERASSSVPRFFDRAHSLLGQL